MATFDRPSRALDAAIRLRDALAEADLTIRVGVHAGEIEVRDDDIAGAVVNVAARVEQAASDGDIYITQTIKDMLIGSARRFEDVGSTELKGFNAPWNLYRVVAD